MLLAAMRAVPVWSFRVARRRESGISRFSDVQLHIRVRSFHERPGMTVVSHSPASPGFTQENSGS
jgi:hypothetical protein